MKTIVLLFPPFLAVWELRERRNDQRLTGFVANEDDPPLHCVGVLHRFRDDRF